MCRKQAGLYVAMWRCMIPAISAARFFGGLGDGGRDDVVVDVEPY